MCCFSDHREVLLKSFVISCRRIAISQSIPVARLDICILFPSPYSYILLVCSMHVIIFWRDSCWLGFRVHVSKFADVALYTYQRNPCSETILKKTTKFNLFLNKLLKDHNCRSNKSPHRASYAWGAINHHGDLLV
jgi:hypothetical protein